MKNAGRRSPSQRLSHGGKDPSEKPGKGIDWDALRLRNEERLDREWDAGLRNPDTIRQRWLRTLTPKERKAEYDLLAQGKRTPLALGVDGEPRKVGEATTPPKNPGGGTGAGGKPRGTRHFSPDEIIRLYVEEDMAPRDIVTKIGGKPSYPTVIKYLKEAGVFDRDRHRTGGRNENGPQRKPQEKCAKGHDMTIEANVLQRYKKLEDGSTRPNGKECRICNRERQRKYNKYKWEKDPRNKKNGGTGR
jgi:hypothetical protein